MTSDRRAMLLVIASAAAARLLYFTTASGVTWETPVLDADTNLRVAQELLGGWPREPFWQPPLYPALLAIFQRFSPSLWPPRVLAAALSCGTAALSFSVARLVRLTRGEALFAGLLVAFYGPLIFYDGELLPTSLGTALATAALWVSLRFPVSPGRGLASGALVGLASLASGPLALLLPVLTLASPRRSPERLRHAVALLTGALLVTAPVLRHNRAHGGGTVLAVNGGINLWIGNNPAMNELVAVRPGAAWDALASEPTRTSEIRSAQDYDAYFTRKALRFCSAEPALCLHNMLEKGRQLFHSSEIPRNENLYLERSRSPVLAALIWRLGPFAFPWGLLGPLAIIGIIRLWFFYSPHERWRVRGLVAALAALVAGPVLFFVAGRYRIPLVPLAAVLAGAGAGALVRGPGRAAGAGLGLVALVAASWPLHLPLERVNYEAEQRYLLAGALLRRGDETQAEAALKAALVARPGYPEAAVNLGVLCARQGRREEALRWLREAQQQAPDDPIARQFIEQLER